VCENNLPTPRVKFLGVFLYPYLNFRLHIKTISAKFPILSIIRERRKNILSQKALTTLYYSLIHSHLIYATQVLTCTSNNIIKEPVIKQKLALRIIHSSSYNPHMESLFKISAILPLPLLADYFKLQFMYLHKFKHLPISFRDTWILNVERREESHLPTLRDEEDYYVPFSRLSSCDTQPLVHFPKKWNQFMRDFCNIVLISCKNLF
jgi:hypothetical protein